MTTLMTSLFFFYPFGALLIAAMPLSAKSHVPEMFFFIMEEILKQLVLYTPYYY